MGEVHGAVRERLDHRLAAAWDEDVVERQSLAREEPLAVGDEDRQRE